ncbi:hypothetical protein ACI6QG_14395 [Roseococcus sp. DSY-14]|uniref:hypothetical protein n=1 Tax=Roseococcus sp. DSY-14 TaxID=3369650 RepID=UPI00387B2D8B
MSRHTDWLYHHLRAEGPPAAVAAFRAAAAGPGLLPWEDELGPAEEDWFLRAMVQPPGRRRLGLEDTRRLAALLRGALEERRARRPALPARVAFDLHALLPVPPALLRRGPEDPAALAWLRAHWGVTQGLRGVVELPPARRDRPRRHLPGLFWVGFFSADWSPWPALLRLRAGHPALQLTLRPLYDGA